MIGHVLDVPKKMAFFDGLRVHSHIDRFLVYSRWQKRFIEDRWRISPDRVAFTPFMVDADFFAPDRARSGDPLGLQASVWPVICSVGLEYRDYPTLLAAVNGLDVHTVLAAASPWSKRPDTTAGQSLPENVTVRRFTQYDLRDLYAASQFLVMPLAPVNFQAGVTAILEAMAMSKAVICSRTPGQTDVVVEQETGLYVPPGDATALRAAIRFLLDHPEEATRMGANGRRRVLAEMSLDCYAERLANFCRVATVNGPIR
jgi:glycosyltransferase involved in cell wall biosynthesis